MRIGPAPKAAGLALVAPGRLLVLHRAPNSSNGDTWGLPAGRLDPGESPLEAACRETREEIGVCPEFDIVGRYSRGGFVAYACVVQPQVIRTPLTLNDEHLAAVWADAGWLSRNRERLHPGMPWLLKDLGSRWPWMVASL